MKGLPQVVLGLAIAFNLVGCGSAEKNTLEKNEAKIPPYQEIAGLPEKIKVAVSPNPVKGVPTPAEAVSTGKPKYTWNYSTSVSSTTSDITVNGIYGYTWQDGKWQPLPGAGGPYDQKQFSQWYTSPDGALKANQTYTDSKNWSGSDDPAGGKRLWVYLGADAAGNKVKGEGEVDCQPVEAKP